MDVALTPPLATVAAGEHKARVEQLELELAKAPQVDLNTRHALAGEVYARTILVPAGTALTGATHRKDHVNVVCGDISVTTETGLKRLTGFHVLATKAGFKRAGFAHADTYWTTVAHTQQQALKAIEDELVDESDRLQTRVLAIDQHPEISKLEEA